MAKKILELFRDSAETQYDTGALPLTGLAALNQGVKFTPIEPAKGDVDTVKFHIQRAKRIKAGDVPTKSGKAATDAIALLDTAKKVDWDTVTVEPATKRAIIVNISAFEENEITEDNVTFMKALDGMTKNTMFEAEERALATVIAGAAGKADLDVTSHDKTVEQVEKTIEEIQELVDDFKAYSMNPIVLIHPSIAKVFSKVQGQSYQTGTNTFPTGLGKGFRYDGIDFFVNPLMNAIESSTDKIAGVIVMDKEAYANAGLNRTVKAFNQEMADERFLGKTYHTMDAVIDADRIKVLEIAKLAKDRTKKVNE